MPRFSVWSATVLASMLNFTFVYAVPGSLIFARENEGCVQNCGDAPVCHCPEDTQCIMTMQTCAECAQVKCVALTKVKKGVSGGAIAGACIAGLLVTAILGFLVYRSYAKKRMNQISMAVTAAEKENDFGMLKSARASTHTVASIASTVRTRASNVIQIAYIPGVTNRSGPSSPAYLVPPVPTLPYSDSPVNSQFPRSPNIDIQFAASDLLRGSICTVDNRSSIATTIYGGNAIVSQPNIIRAGKAAVVTVKGGNSAATSNSTSPIVDSPSVPAVPAVYLNAGSSLRGKATAVETVPLSPAFSIGSTFFNRMNSKNESESTLSEQPQRRAVSGRSGLAHENHSVNYDSDDSDFVPGHRSNDARSNCSSCITDMDAGSPFSDANSMVLDAMLLPPGPDVVPPVTNQRQSGIGGSSSRASQLIDMSRPRDSLRTSSPFDDSHSIDKQR